MTPATTSIAVPAPVSRRKPTRSMIRPPTNEAIGHPTDMRAMAAPASKALRPRPVWT